MKLIRWSPLKSERLKRTRGVSFEELLEGRLVTILKHPQRAEQHILVYDYKRYLWAVPFIENEEIIFLKTLYPSRSLMKRFGRK